MIAILQLRNRFGYLTDIELNLTEGLIDPQVNQIARNFSWSVNATLFVQLKESIHMITYKRNQGILVRV